ncbi:ComEC/Rec2 family competence protein [Thioclava sp. 'Guangxiensis']|uniref:ComEC/Rec2 family competence protein n=1 Tax=Thioclava sp. 'Guangxiensis' TaxID=3149044 RepID=UPI0038782837
MSEVFSQDHMAERESRWYARALTVLGHASMQAYLQLMLWLPLGLGTGIGLWFGLKTEPDAPVYLMAGGIVALAGVGRGRLPVALWFPCAMIGVMALGFCLAGLRAHLVAAPVLDFRYYGTIEGRVLSLDRSASDRPRLLLDRLRLDRVAPERLPAKVRVSLHGTQDHLALRPGQRVMLTGYLMPPPPPAAPDAFDFRRIAFFQQIGAVGYSRTPVMLIDPPQGAALLANRLRERLSRLILAHLPGQNGAIASAILTGDRSALSESTNEVMRAANIYHVVAISGLHVGLLTGLVFAFVRLCLAGLGRPALLWPSRKIAAVVAILAASAYLWLSGGQVSTQRAWVMAAVMLGAVIFDRRALSLRNVALAAIVILMATPEALLNPGFQLSFAATVALISGLALWVRLAPRLPHVLRVPIGFGSSSLIAGLATAPLTAATFHRMADYGLVANLLAVPAMGMVIMPAGLLALALAPLGLGGPAFWLLGLGTGWLLGVARMVAGWPGSVTAVKAPPELVVALLGAGAVVFILSRGIGRGGGALALCLAALIWWQAPRPALIVAPEAEQVGLMTPAGRALSRDGAGFVAGIWLEADGDMAGISEAASRPAWAGDKGIRHSHWRSVDLVHLTGKAAPDHLSEYCRDGALVIIAAELPPDLPRDTVQCRIWDRARLAQTGAVSWGEDGSLTSVRERVGRRLWTTPELYQ